MLAGDRPPPCYSLVRVADCGDGVRLHRLVRKAGRLLLTDFYDLMMSRNYAYLDPADQARLRASRVLVAGCGLGSNIAALAAQTGFTSFVCVDHDAVEVSNLNRQVFDRRHIGRNKAEALGSVLREKSEAVRAEAHPVHLTPDNAAAFVENADIVVNTVDFDNTMVVLDEVCSKQGKASVFPLNLGWAHGFCIAFTPGSARLSGMVGDSLGAEEQVFFRLLREVRGWEPPAYFQASLGDMERERFRRGYNPQLGVGAWVIAAVVVDVLVRLTLGLPVNTAPYAMTSHDMLTLPREA